MIAAILSILASVLGFFKPKSDEAVARDAGQVAGQDHEIAAVNSKAANTTAAMAQAQADSPQTKADMLAALDKGAV